MPSSLGLSVALLLFGPCPHLRFQSFVFSLLRMMIIGMLVATGDVAGRVLSERSWLEISCPMAEMIGCYCGAAAIWVEAALSYFFMKMKMQAAAACAAANIEKYVPDSLCVVAGGLVSDLLLTSAALASVGIKMKTRWHAAAASAATAQ